MKANKKAVLLALAGMIFMKANKKAVLLALAGMIFIAAQWQLEIADNFLLNGWGAYTVLFNWIQISDVWAVRDFWMLVLDAVFLVVVCFALPLEGEQKP